MEVIRGMRIKGETTCLCSCAPHQSTFNHYKIRTRTRHGLGMPPCMRLEMLEKADEMEEIERRRSHTSGRDTSESDQAR